MRLFVAIFLLVATAALGATRYVITPDGVAYNVTVSSGIAYSEANIYTPEGYGAAGDGSTDDSDEINAMFAAMAADSQGGVARFSGKTYYIGTTTLSLLDAVGAVDEGPRTIIDFGGATILADSALNGPILAVGDTNGVSRCIDLLGGKFKYNNRAFKDGNSCIALINTYDVNVDRAGVKNGFAGIELRGSKSSGAGSAHNRVHVVAVDCLNAFYLNRTTSGSWVNENNIYGRASYTSALTAVDCSAGYAIHMKENDTAGNTLNNNKFYGVSCEANAGISNPPKSCKYIGTYNVFFDPRFEGFATPYFVITESTDRLQVFGGYDINTIAKVDTLYPQAFNSINNYQSQIVGGNSTQGALRVSNRSSSDYMALEVMNSGHTASYASITGNGDTALRDLTLSGSMELDTYTHPADTDTINAQHHGMIFLTQNTANMRLKFIENGESGQVIMLVGVNAGAGYTIVPDSTGFALQSDWTGTDDDILTLVYDGSQWIEVSRATN